MKRKHKDMRHGQYFMNFLAFIRDKTSEDSDIFYMSDWEYESLEKEYLKSLEK